MGEKDAVVVNNVLYVKKRGVNGRLSRILCYKKCYSYITNNSNLLIFVFGSAKMQPWKNSVQWNSRLRYGFRLATVCAPGIRRSGCFRELQMPGNR